jgi:hypothetical protein
MFIVAVLALNAVIQLTQLVVSIAKCHNPSSHGEESEADKTTKEQRQKETPDPLERDSGVDETGDVR